MLSKVKTLTPYDLIPNFVALAAWILIEEECGLDRILAQLRRSKKPNLLMEADAQLDKVLARLRLNEPEPRRDMWRPMRKKERFSDGGLTRGGGKCARSAPANNVQHGH
jgi:hypothetical protein